MDTAIFGAGVAGLTTAIALRSIGRRSRIFERAPQSQGAGMGFVLVPECVGALQGLSVDPGGVPLERYLFRDEAGRILQEQRLPRGCRGIRRSDLIAALTRALPADESIAFDSELVHLHFDPGGMVRCAEVRAGKHVSSVHAALFVAADGVGSRARHALFPDWRIRQAQVREIVGLVRSPDAIAWAANNFNKFHAAEGGIALGVLSVDAGHVVWFLQYDAHRFHFPGENANARRNFVYSLVGGWAEPIPHLLAQTDFSRVHLWLPVDTDLIPYFNQGNLVLAGDAAHPLLPFTSRGVSCAVADAVALADALNAERDIARALAAYSAQQRRYSAPFLEKGRELLRHFLQPMGTLHEIPIA